jgi:transposase InsO family protein
LLACRRPCHPPDTHYLAVVLDWLSRRVLAWRLSITMDAAFSVES